MFILLSDVFDCITLEQCDPLFTFVEERVSTWTMVSETASVTFPTHTVSDVC